MRRIVNALMVLSVIGVFGVALIPEPVSAMTGAGTAGDPYMIYDVNDLQNVANGAPYAPGAYYGLANDIDAFGTTTWNWDAGRGVYEGFVPIPAFTGLFDGNGYSITNLYINRDYAGAAYVGLFSSISGAGLVANVSVLDADITIIKTGINEIYGGILGGYLAGDIYQCGTTGTIVCNGTSSVVNGVGGLVGRTYTASSSVSKSFSYADVEYRDTCSCTNVAAGGLIGYHNGGYIYDSYARGDVYGYSTYINAPSVGGLVGRIYQAYVYRSYSTGFVDAFTTGRSGGLIGTGYQGVVTSSFWDYQTSGLGVSAGGSARSTAQMKTESTFTGAGWDFATIWDIGGTINNGYPYLLWWYTPYPWPGLPSNFTQVLWFQPNDLIYGTTLPDRMTNQDGAITWGANPAGITVTVGGFVSAEQPTPGDTGDTPSSDFLPTAETTDWFLDPDISGTLADNPLRPFVRILSDYSTLTEWQAWRFLGLVFVVFCTALAAFKLRGHLFIAGVTCALAMVILIQQTIWPLWTVLFVIAAVIAGVIAERTPQV